MSNVTGYNEESYWSLPNDLMLLGLIKKMDAKSLKLYLFITFRAQKFSRAKLLITNEEISRYLGLDNDRTVKSAQKMLADLSLLRVERDSHGYQYQLLSPSSGNDWVVPKKAGAGSFIVQNLSEDGAKKYYLHRLDASSIECTANGLKARCPFHEGNGQTFQVRLSGGSAWNCLSCDAKGGLFDFEVQLAKLKGEFITAGEGRKRTQTVLRHLGVIDATTGTPQAVYDYRDEQGKLLYQKVRYPGKSFFSRRPDLKDPTKWVNGLGSVQRVLYNLEAVMKAKVVCVVEGEKDADRVTGLGLTVDSYEPIAITTPGGCKEWKPKFAYSLKGKHVIVIPHNDDGGKESAKQIMGSLEGYAASSIVRELPKEFNDCSEMLDVCPEAREFAAFLNSEHVYMPADWKDI